MLEECAIVCIAKNEEKYIEEWITYHFKIGVSAITIYDNSDNYSLGYLNIKYRNKIHVIHWAGDKIIKSPFSENRTYQGKRCCATVDGIQMWAYDHYILNYKKTNKMFKWVAFIDCDEFIYLKNKNQTIVQFFNQINFNEGILTINWVHFGSNGHKKYENKPVLERFTKRESNGRDIHKSICVINDTISTNHSMHDFKTNKFWRKSNNIKHGPTHFSPIVTDSIFLAHFAVKSLEEFDNKKRNRTWSGDGEYIRDMKYFNEFDCNNIIDNSLFNFMKK